MKKITTVFIVCSLLFIIGIVLLFPESFICEGYRFECRDQYDEYRLYAGLLTIIAPIVFFAYILIHLYQTQRIVFNSWLRFAKYYLPIAAVLIILMPAVDSTIGGFDKEFMTWLLAGVFFAASLGVIFFKRNSSRSLISK